LKKGNNSLTASIPTLPGGALKGGGKIETLYSEVFGQTLIKKPQKKGGRNQ
jgi:hypothetical protein